MPHAHHRHAGEGRHLRLSPQMSDLSDPVCPWTVNLAVWMLIAVIVASAATAALACFNAQAAGHSPEVVPAFYAAFVTGCIDLIFLIFAIFLWSPGYRWVRLVYLMALLTIALPMLRDQLSGHVVLAGCIKLYLVLTYLFLIIPRSVPWFQKAPLND